MMSAKMEARVVTYLEVTAVIALQLTLVTGVRMVS